jgi:hypothetical protein
MAAWVLVVDRMAIRWTVIANQVVRPMMIAAPMTVWIAIVDRKMMRWISMLT